MKTTTRTALIQSALLLASFILSMGLFLISYRFDNKYTFRGPQPIGGILFFDPASDSMTHLINGWQYYQEKLLTPKDFEGELPVPDGYLSVGQYPGLEAGRPDAPPHGSMTYSLILALPETPAYYTLELPEIYSAFRLYVGDFLAASRGTPEKDAYEASVHSGSVTFKAAGDTRILLAVSDWSWLYSGLVYPPAFGRPEPVSSLLEQKFAWGLTATALALLLGISGLALSVILKNRKTLCASFICISFAVSVCAPPLHRLIDTGIVPFYNAELFCRYAVYGFAVLLVNLMYGRRTKITAAVSAAAILFPFAALVLSFAAPVLSYRAMLVFSGASGLYKLLCALWILVLAFLLGRRSGLDLEYTVLLSGACVFASSLVADRLLPGFEPVRFGWYSETAGLIFVCLISFMMFRESYLIYQERGVLAQQILLQKKHYSDLVDQMQTIRTMRHDIRHHFTQLGLLLKGGRYEDAADYLNRLNASPIQTAPLTFCDNYAADVLLRYYYAKAKDSGIPVSIHADLPSDTGVLEEDLSVILGNVLENALEACLRAPAAGRFLSLTLAKRYDNLMIRSSNAFTGELTASGDAYRSAKEQNRIGIGLSSVRAIVKKYDGDVWIETGKKDGTPIFSVQILMITDAGRSSKTAPS